jgi:penicillin-binding protein 1A
VARRIDPPSSRKPRRQTTPEPAKPLKTAKAIKGKRPRTVFKGHLKWRLAGMGLLLLALAFGVYYAWACIYDLDQLGVLPQRTWVYDCRGKPFSRLSGEDRVTAPIAQISPHFIHALIAREDTRFYEHHGVDPTGIARAMVRNAIHLHAKEGASTLTQQLARNVFPLGGHNLHRKILEAFVAARIERNRTKAQILEAYVNRIYFGSGFYGVETASRAYFGKPSAKLSLSEGAILAGLIRSPNRFSPFRNLERSLRERDTVLGRMEKLGMITPEQAAAARAEPVRIASTRPPGVEQSYAMDLVEQNLNLILDEDQIDSGGLKVFTSIDPELQRAAEAALDTQLSRIEQRDGYKHPKRADFDPAAANGETPYLQGAAIVIDNATGGIRAVVGGRSYAESTYNRALLASRPVGSTFKPFVYAAAYASGAVTPETGISDDPIRNGELQSAPRWHPGNSDGNFLGILPAEEGLIRSRNTMSVRIGDKAGVGAVCRLGQKAGLGEIPRFPSSFLGSFSANLKEMTAAYTIFPNSGIRRQPFVIERIEDASGKAIYRAAHIESRALDARVSALVSSALEKVMQRGTAAGADFHQPAAGKTGTTNDYRDAWFIGYTHALTCGVWVGLDKPVKIMPHGYGATLALPVWCDVMNLAVKGRYPAGALPHAGEGPGVLRSIRKLFGG